MGVRAINPPNFFKYDRAPIVKDFDNFVIGDIWLQANSENVWLLTKKKANVATV